FNLDAFAALVRLESDTGMAVLAAATGLTDELAFAFGKFGDGFAIGDLGRTGISANFEFAEQTVADDLEMQLTHARDTDLAGFFIGETTEGRVFLSQALQAFPHFLAVGLGLGLARH